MDENLERLGHQPLLAQLLRGPGSEGHDRLVMSSQVTTGSANERVTAVLCRSERTSSRRRHGTPRSS
ncbi:hypothetical protein DS843_28480 [Roseomonas genomospecies 6]|uniref:Uncharacterized protein n=1 Tax=Roseomonas genomospecies 6 TaxID=214106 RepID=A0A9W7KNF6_9PROT|nr:hypothetical protein DS843_28480 [Roseomonas genomospecies 6]